MSYDYAESKIKWDRLNELINHTDACGPRPTTPPYNDDDHDANLTHLRDIFVNLDDYVPSPDEYTPLAQAHELHELVQYFFSLSESETWGPYRDELSTLALSMSLCPMHLCDYASCFDDDDDECSQIRAMFPSHDT